MVLTDSARQSSLAGDYGYYDEVRDSAFVPGRALAKEYSKGDRCTGCLKCEEACPANCIKAVSRYVDNTRCVRCFDCLHVCGDDAIHYQPNRNRPATPLMRKAKT